MGVPPRADPGGKGFGFLLPTRSFSDYPLADSLFTEKSERRDQNIGIDHFLGQRTNRSSVMEPGPRNGLSITNRRSLLRRSSADVDRRSVPKPAIQTWKCACMGFSGDLGTVISFQGLSLFHSRTPAPTRTTARCQYQLFGRYVI